MKKIKCIIQVSDIHIRNFMRLDEYVEQLGKFIDKCKEIASNYEKDEVRIVICGDLVHQKNTISNELMIFASQFIRQLEEIATVIVIAGNHDLVLNNLSRKDTITSLFETAKFQNAYFLDYELDFMSGYLVDNNITWVLYSIYDDYNAPNIEKAKEEYPDNICLGLFHGMVSGSMLSNGTITESGIDGNIFTDCRYVLAGDIHKRQVLDFKGTELVYPGSLIQQNLGETISQHGFCVWDLEHMEHKFIDLESEYGFYKFKIESFDDIENNNEQLTNFQ